MPTVEQVLTAAAERASQKNLSYAGAVTPVEAQVLREQGGAKVIDVRARHEHEYIGRIPGSQLIEWKFWPSGEVNAGFVDELRKQYGPDDRLLFLCRSGVRSHAAAQAATQAGFKYAFNILEGFEGDLDDTQQRGKVGGWRKAGLPWIQS